MEQLAVFLLGSNLGDRLMLIEKATEDLIREIGTAEHLSSVYESSPWGKTDQPPFLNRVVSIRTSLDPFTVLQKCLEMEQSVGRIRTEQWGPRTIDIDILYFGEMIIDTQNLKIPHPGIPERRFTLVPLCEIHPESRHPESGSTHLQLLDACQDQGVVRFFNLLA